MIETIHTDDAPAAIGTYSQATRYDNLIFVSGQIGLDAEMGNFVSAQFEAQSVQAFKNLKMIIEAAGSELKNVLKLNVSVVSMADFSCFNEVMEQFFSEPYPARAVVAVAELPKGALVEIEAVAALVR